MVFGIWRRLEVELVVQLGLPAELFDVLEQSSVEQALRTNVDSAAPLACRGLDERNTDTMASDTLSSQLLLGISHLRRIQPK